MKSKEGSTPLSKLTSPLVAVLVETIAPQVGPCLCVSHGDSRLWACTAHPAPHFDFFQAPALRKQMQPVPSSAAHTHFSISNLVLIMMLFFSNALSYSVFLIHKGSRSPLWKPATHLVHHTSCVTPLWHFSSGGAFHISNRNLVCVRSSAGTGDRAEARPISSVFSKTLKSCCYNLRFVRDRKLIENREAFHTCPCVLWWTQWVFVESLNIVSPMRSRDMAEMGVSSRHRLRLVQPILSKWVRQEMSLLALYCLLTPSPSLLLKKIPSS